MIKKRNDERFVGKIYRIFLILMVFLFFNFIPQVNAQEITTEGITVIPYESGINIFGSIKKIYEISPSSLEEGHSESLREREAFRVNIKSEDYYIFVLNVTEKDVIVIFPGRRELSFSPNGTTLTDIDQDGELDIELRLESISGKLANFYIGEFVEEKLIPSGDYFELFDVTVRLADEVLYSSRELEAFIVFENFGEGASQIDIAYSIIDENGIEVYRGVDNKVVQTEDRVVKDFDFLELPFGKYILRTDIFYGKNQTGEAEQDFEIIRKPFSKILGVPLILIGIIFVLLGVVVYARWLVKKVGGKRRRKQR